MKTLKELNVDFRQFLRNENIASKPYIYATLCSYFSFLCTIRATGKYKWINEENIQAVEFCLLFVTIFLCLYEIIAIHTESSKYASKLNTSTKLLSLTSLLKGIILTVCYIYFFSKFPIYKFEYDFGGASALVTASITSYLASLLFFLDSIYFYDFKLKQTLRQKKYQDANAFMVWYIIFGSIIFSYIENWDFERSSQFVVCTLVTIGYGNLAPKTSLGRFILILYGLIGFLVIRYYFIAFEDIVIDETVKLAIIPMP
jgi:hypothetical protein